MSRPYKRPEFRILSFDFIEFGRQVAHVRQVRSLSLKAVEAQTSIAFATIHSIEKGRISGAAPIICIAHWADIDVNDFVRVNLIPTEPRTAI